MVQNIYFVLIQYTMNWLQCQNSLIKLNKIKFKNVDKIVVFNK